MPTPPPETILTTKHRLHCDGGGGALGHPRVFLEMGEKDHVDCPYCGRRYVFDKAHAHTDHH